MKKSFFQWFTVCFATTLVVPTALPSVAVADVSDNSFSVFAVGDYLYQNKLSNSDAWVFRDRLVQRNWIKDTELYQGDVIRSSLASKGKYSDMVYFTGHGGTDGGLLLRDNTKVYWSDIGSEWNGLEGAEWQDVEWAIFAACNVLQRNSWGTILTNGAHHLFGYRDLSDDNTDDYIAQDFIGQMYLNKKMITAWQWANLSYSEQDWAVTGHKGNENDYFHGVSTGATIDITGTSDIYHWYQGGGFYLTISGLAEADTTIGKTKIAKSKKLGKVSVEAEKLNYKQLAKNLVGDQYERVTSGPFHADSYVNQDSSLNVYPSGAINYARERSYEPLNFSMEQAMGQADDFVKKNGGIPKDAKMVSVHPFMGKNEQTGFEYANGYLVTYEHDLEGVQIDGKAGDSIKVFVDASGVPFYSRTWREVKTKVDNTEKDPISSEAAMTTAKNTMPARYKADVMPDIDRVEMVYWSMPFGVNQTEMIPAWKVTSGSHSIYIDAHNGSVLDEKKYLPDLTKVVY